MRAINGWEHISITGPGPINTGMLKGLDPPVTVITCTNTQRGKCYHAVLRCQVQWGSEMQNVLKDKAHTFFMVNKATLLLWYDNEHSSSCVLSWACNHGHIYDPHLARWNRFSSALQDAYLSLKNIVCYLKVQISAKRRPHSVSSRFPVDTWCTSW